MTEGFDKDFWERHWREGAAGSGSMSTNPANPCLDRELRELRPGTALDAGCGSGAEAIWLAERGWDVTAADISAGALARAAERAAASGVAADGRLRWVEADLSRWEPDATFDLVMTHYAHPAMPQLAFYERIAEWVAPGGTLLIVGHRHTADGVGHGHMPGGHGHGGHDHRPPAEASATAGSITAGLSLADWQIVTAEEPTRMLTGPEGREVTLHDVVVRATRRATHRVAPTGEAR